MAREPLPDKKSKDYMPSISSYHDGVYFCHECAHCWKPSRRYQVFPIKVKFYPSTWSFYFGGYEVGADGPEQLVFVRVISIGPFRIIFGNENYVPKVTHDNNIWIRNKDVIR